MFPPAFVYVILCNLVKLRAWAFSSGLSTVDPAGVSAARSWPQSLKVSHQSVKTYMYRYVIVATAGWYQAVSVLVDGKAKINNQIPFSEFKSKIIILGLGKLNVSVTGCMRFSRSCSGVLTPCLAKIALRAAIHWWRRFLPMPPSRPSLTVFSNQWGVWDKGGNTFPRWECFRVQWDTSSQFSPPAADWARKHCSFMTWRTENIWQLCYSGTYR